MTRISYFHQHNIFIKPFHGPDAYLVVPVVRPAAKLHISHSQKSLSCYFSALEQPLPHGSADCCRHGMHRRQQHRIHSGARSGARWPAAFFLLLLWRQIGYPKPAKAMSPTGTPTPAPLATPFVLLPPLEAELKVDNAAFVVVVVVLVLVAELEVFEVDEET
jgi:hypothetical protein